LSPRFCWARSDFKHPRRAPAHIPTRFLPPESAASPVFAFRADAGLSLGIVLNEIRLKRHARACPGHDATVR
jgi:hypothetical protein